ncbi:MAG: hypothetical protein Q4G26_10115 [Paracoccus sp. (in: a-proteobacteria)]|nr:hypothetical protein [Paracoccus sp. (in: a-proteobacteria)]
MGRKAGDPAVRCPEKKENIILIGSELEYDSFWLKMMFMSCGIGVGRGLLSPPGYSAADKTTILYATAGYVRHELLAVEYVRTIRGHDLIRIAAPSTVTNHMRNRVRDGQTYKINNLVIFSHGTPGTIRLEYPRTSGDLAYSHFASVPADVFCPTGHIISYACNTAYSSTVGGSLAHRLASHFGVTIKAFDGLTNYGNCLRSRIESDSIVSALNENKGSSGGGVVNISDDHEALPHPGLGGFGAWREGTRNYALWRKDAARALPVQHPGSGNGMRDYRR